MKPVWVMKSDPMSKIKEKKSKEKKRVKTQRKKEEKENHCFLETITIDKFHLLEI